MNKKNFDIWMNSIDCSYLEEAAMTPKKKHTYRYLALAAAAYLVLAATGLLFRHSTLSGTTPDNVSNIAENITPTTAPDLTPDNSITREYFAKDGANYTLLTCEVPEPTEISDIEIADTEPLVWVAGGLEIKLCSTNDIAWVSWYDSSSGIQWCLMSDTSSLALLTTAKNLVEELGYNVAVAPAHATDVTYDAFRINDLTVAETAFLLNGTRYSYRMAATADVSADFADISGTGTFYDIHTTTEVGWCPARLYYTENGYGKIIWFDIVPGLLYSLSMETDASEESLLTLAHELFAPAQDAAAW